MGEKAHPGSMMALDVEIARYAAEGFRIVSRTGTSAQLVKPKQFNFWLALFFLIGLGWVFGIGVILLIIYVLYYIAKREEQVYLAVDPGGNVSVVSGP